MTYNSTTTDEVMKALPESYKSLPGVTAVKDSFGDVIDLIYNPYFKMGN
jgi:hypothetical protein